MLIAELPYRYAVQFRALEAAIRVPACGVVDADRSGVGVEIGCCHRAPAVERRPRNPYRPRPEVRSGRRRSAQHLRLGPSGGSRVNQVRCLVLHVSALCRIRLALASAGFVHGWSVVFVGGAAPLRPLRPAIIRGDLDNDRFLRMRSSKNDGCVWDFIHRIRDVDDVEPHIPHVSDAVGMSPSRRSRHTAVTGFESRTTDGLPCPRTRLKPDHDRTEPSARVPDEAVAPINPSARLSDHSWALDIDGYRAARLASRAARSDALQDL